MALRLEIRTGPSARPTGVKEEKGVVSHMDSDAARSGCLQFHIMFVSVNAIRPQRKARTRDAIGEVRHVFLDADRDGEQLLATIGSRRDLPVPSYVLHSSPNRVHVLWKVQGFTRESVEALQKHLARELKTDKAATSCAQITRLPGFFNHKYRPAPMIVAQYIAREQVFGPADFPPTTPTSVTPRTATSTTARSHSELDVIERARRYLTAMPPAVMGQHGDATTFRACCRLVRGFDLADDDALDVLNEWNARCEPPWSEGDLRRKLAAARRYGREPIGGLIGAR